MDKSINQSINLLSLYCKSTSGTGKYTKFTYMTFANAQVTQWGILMVSICEYIILQCSWWIPHYSLFVLKPLRYSPLHSDNNLMFKNCLQYWSNFEFAIIIQHYRYHILLCGSSTLGHLLIRHTVFLFSVNSLDILPCSHLVLFCGKGVFTGLINSHLFIANSRGN